MSLSLTQKQVTEISRAFRIEPESLGKLSFVRGGFSGAEIRKFESEGRAYALRRWTGNGLPRERLEGLHQLIRWWNTEGIVEIPLPQRTTEGSTLLQIEGEGWQVEPWMPGLADFESNPNSARLREVMHWLARLHLITPRYQTSGGTLEWFQPRGTGNPPAIRERLEIVQGWTPEKVISIRGALEERDRSQLSIEAKQILQQGTTLLKHLAWELRVAQALQVPLFPCLRDLWHDHVLFTDDRVTGIVDPSACRIDSVASDLSRLLGSLLQGNTARWDEASGFYEEIRPFQADERQLIEIYDRSQSLLAGLYWVEQVANNRIDPASETSISTRLSRIKTKLEGMAI